MVSFPPCNTGDYTMAKTLRQRPITRAGMRSAHRRRWSGAPVLCFAVLQPQIKRIIPNPIHLLGKRAICNCQEPSRAWLLKLASGPWLKPMHLVNFPLKKLVHHLRSLHQGHLKVDRFGGASRGASWPSAHSLLTQGTRAHVELVCSHLIDILEMKCPRADRQCSFHLDSKRVCYHLVSVRKICTMPQHMYA